MHCIGDEDTVHGFRLAGVEGDIVLNAPEALTALTKTTEQSDVAIIVLTDDIAGQLKAQVDQIRFERERPLILEIPGQRGAAHTRKSLRQIVQEAVGLSMDVEKGT